MSPTTRCAGNATSQSLAWPAGAPALCALVALHVIAAVAQHTNTRRINWVLFIRRKVPHSARPLTSPLRPAMYTLSSTTDDPFPPLRPAHDSHFRPHGRHRSLRLGVRSTGRLRPPSD